MLNQYLEAQAILKSNLEHPSNSNIENDNVPEFLQNLQTVNIDPETCMVYFTGQPMAQHSLQSQLLIHKSEEQNQTPGHSPSPHHLQHIANVLGESVCHITN
jgi:hypothetical protein